MGTIIPSKRPECSRETGMSFLGPSGLDPNKEVCLLGVRGFFSPIGQNKRMIYDDAVFLMAPDGLFVPFNANCDPGYFKKGIANLKDGVWEYRIGTHGLGRPLFMQYQALVQEKPVTVSRDLESDQTGFFGINIHRGGYTKVSSLGCQTIVPTQWESFISLVKDQLLKNDQKTIKYFLTTIK